MVSLSFFFPFFLLSKSNFFFFFFFFFLVDCRYNIGVEIIFSTSFSMKTTTEALILEGGGGFFFFFNLFFIYLFIYLFIYFCSSFLHLGVPLISFDDISSSCSTITGNGEVYLALGPIEGLGEGDEVKDYVWEQLSGEEVTCDERLFLNVFFLVGFYF